MRQCSRCKRAILDDDLYTIRGLTEIFCSVCETGGFGKGPNPKDALGKKKPPLSLIPASAQIAEAMAMKQGAEDYGPYNWRDTEVEALVYVDAAMRHILRYLDGEEADPKSGAHPLAHARACLAILIDAEASGCLIDNRPTKGKADELIESYAAPMGRKPDPPSTGSEQAGSPASGGDSQADPRGSAGDQGQYREVVTLADKVEAITSPALDGANVRRAFEGDDAQD